MDGRLKVVLQMRQRADRLAAAVQSSIWLAISAAWATLSARIKVGLGLCQQIEFQHRKGLAMVLKHVPSSVGIIDNPWRAVIAHFAYFGPMISPPSLPALYAECYFIQDQVEFAIVGDAAKSSWPRDWPM